ncbi:MAG: beta-galactosidase, partial [Clostridiales bacterium]|nr:beta-galactosidase [Clostridiales bacterium]
MAYRQEHPKPQFERPNWMNLNGKWEFQDDPGDSGLARGLSAPEAAFDSEIEVPFCPQSRLSGIGHTDFYRAVWYRRRVTLTREQLAGRVFLHFGAVDYEAQVFVNGALCGSHRGGYVSFALEITGQLREGKNTVTVYVRDDERSPLIPSGKQCQDYRPGGCFYTRTTGIWQTVWLEFTPRVYLRRVRLLPEAGAGSLTVQAFLEGCAPLTLSASFEGRDMG